MSRKPSFQTLSLPSFRYFLATRFFLTLALQMQAVIIGWKIYEITNDPFSIGLVGLAEAIPSISIALYAGHMADLHKRKTILLISLAGIILSSLGLFFGFSGPLAGSKQLICIYSFIALSGLARGFYGPASFATISLLVPKSLLTYAGTQNSTVWQFGAVIGPALGGFFYAWFGLTGAFLFILGFSAFAFLALVQIRPATQQVTLANEPILARLKEGVGFVFRDKIILSALSLDLFSVLFGGAVALLPVFANEILHTGPEGLGILRAAPSLGAVITMIILSLRRTIHEAGIVLIRAVAGFGFCMLLFGISESYFLSLILLFLSGAFDSVSVVIRSNILQVHTPDHMRGRVSAVNTIFIGSSNEIGAFESGLAAKLMGTAASVIFGGMMTLGIVGLTYLKAPTLRKLKFD